MLDDLNETNINQHKNVVYIIYYIIIIYIRNKWYHNKKYNFKRKYCYKVVNTVYLFKYLKRKNNLFVRKS